MTYQRSALRHRVVPTSPRTQATQSASSFRTAQSSMTKLVARLALWAKTIAHGLVK
jgi:hypothetical protein